MPAVAQSHCLRVRRLTKVYGDQAALDDVSLEVGRGRFITLLGPSGSGKTTLLMVVAGFVTPTSGQIFLDERDVTSDPPEQRKFGMVFQGYALFPNMTVEENVWFPLRVRGLTRRDARNAVRATLDLVRMWHLADRLPGQLSGGQQQRVALARALVFEPHLLLLDEPLSALDRRLRADLQWELRSLHRRLGATFVSVTHDQEEALSMSDEIAILRAGRIEQVGSPHDLYARPRSRFVASFLGDSNFVRGQLAGIEGESFHLRVGDLSIVQAGSPHTAARDGSVLLALRPEKLRLSRSQPGTVNVVSGEIEDAKFQGTSHHVQVRTRDIGTLAVTTPAWQSGIDFEPGRPVWIGWEPDAGVAVTES